VRLPFPPLVAKNLFTECSQVPLRIFAATDLSAREKAICERLGPALRERGLLFTGIDVIDGYLTEINVTSPTGIRIIRRLGGPDIAAIIWDRIGEKIGT
jgi:glutathione synthase